MRWVSFSILNIRGGRVGNFLQFVVHANPVGKFEDFNESGKLDLRKTLQLWDEIKSYI